MLRNEQALDALLNGERHGTFHDAALLSVHVDYLAQRFVAEFEICVGDPDAPDESTRERRRRGQLRIEGLKAWALEPPDELPTDSSGGLWLTSDGPLAESPTEAGKALARRIRTEGVGWFLYFNDLNAFGYVAGERATFTWADASAV